MASKLAPTGGLKTVTASGTAEAIVASETRVLSVVFQAMSGNTNPVYIGDSSVNKTTSPQVALEAKESLSIIASDVSGGAWLDLNEFYVDADTNGEGVSYLYIS